MIHSQSPQFPAPRFDPFLLPLGGAITASISHLLRRLPLVSPPSILLQLLQLVKTERSFSFKDLTAVIAESGEKSMKERCTHYKRRCKIRAPCCNEIFSCRHCHNEATSMLSRIADRHELDRYEVKQVVCEVCDTEQPVAQVCTNCEVNMGEYFCDICKFYDDDVISSFYSCDILRGEMFVLELDT